MKIILAFSFLLAAALVVGVTLSSESGYVLISIGQTQIEMTLFSLLMFVGLACLTIWGIFTLIARVFRAPQQLRVTLQERERKRGSAMLLRGIIDVGEGRLRKGEKRLVGAASISPIPLVNYLVAAGASQLSEANDRRDQHFQEAHRVQPEAASVILLAQAKFQIQHGQFESALANLYRLRRIQQHHPLVISLLMQIYLRLEEYAQLADILIEAKRLRVFNQKELMRLQCIAYSALASSADSESAIGVLVKKTPKEVRKHPQVASAFAKAWIKTGNDLAAIKALEESIGVQASRQTLALYSQLERPPASKRLHQVENWLTKHGNTDSLLLAGADLAMQSTLWGQARGYLEQVGTEDIQFALLSGRLAEAENHPQQALGIYREALRRLSSKLVTCRLMGENVNCGPDRYSQLR